MEKRREPRFQADQPVTVTVLTESRQDVPARVRNVSGRGLGVVASARVEPGAGLLIELEDTKVLAEAIYCRPDPEGFFIGIEMDQMLVGLTELGRHLAAFTSEVAVERRGSAGADTMCLPHVRAFEVPARR